MSDGVALRAVDHPVGEIQVTEQMLMVGDVAFANQFGVTRARRIALSERCTMLAAIYRAMASQAPIQDLDEESLVTGWIELPVHPLIEKFAIRCAKGNNGGEWLKKPNGEQHYTDKQKDYWRNFVRELISDTHPDLVAHLDKARRMLGDMRVDLDRILKAMDEGK